MEVLPPGAGLREARPPHAGELFTDRQLESTVFKHALAKFRKNLDSRSRDEVVARRNIVVLYGLGGIGKTTLSARLDSWVKRELALDNGWGPPPATRVSATARIDLHPSAGRLDLATTLVALRSGFGGLRARWPLFDLTFTAYWSAVRPGEPLPSFPGGTQMSETVLSVTRAALGEVGGLTGVPGAGTGAGLAVDRVRTLVSHIRRHRDIHLGVSAYAGFEDFLVACADEPGPLDTQPDLAVEIAGCLAYELACLSPTPLVVVFVDATERLNLDPGRYAEAQLNKLVHRMPNVLFVLTGRDTIDWWDAARTNLAHRGPWTWPGLVPGTPEEPAQHLVGNLSPQDARAAVLRARQIDDLPMSDEVVAELVEASAGLPQYLELARQVAQSVKASGRGRNVTVSDVTGSRADLVLRVLDDIPADEQRAIRGACLFRTFDIALMAAAGGVDHGTAQRACRRPMVDRFGAEPFPLRLHDAVREAIRHVDHRIAGGWAELDWQFASTRAAARAHQMHDDAVKAGRIRDVLDALATVIRLVSEQRTELEPADSSSYRDWLTQAIVYAPSIQGLRSRVPPVSRTEYGRHVLNFIAASSLETPFDDRVHLLNATFASDHPLKLAAGRHLGYTLRKRYRWDEALAIFDRLFEIAPTRLHQRQRSVTLSHARRFKDAAQAASDARTVDDMRRIAQYYHGIPDQFFSEMPGRITELAATNRLREAMQERGTLLSRRALFLGDVMSNELEEFQDAAEVSGDPVTIRDALRASVITRLLSEDFTRSTLARLRALEQAARPDGRVGFRFGEAELLDALVTEDLARVRRVHAELAEIPERAASWIPLECLLDAVGYPLPSMPTQWNEPYPEVRARWAAHLARYLARHTL